MQNQGSTMLNIQNYKKIRLKNLHILRKKGCVNIIDLLNFTVGPVTKLSDT